jgi:hypothetical protein
MKHTIPLQDAIYWGRLCRSLERLAVPDVRGTVLCDFARLLWTLWPRRQVALRASG